MNVFVRGSIDVCIGSQNESVCADCRGGIDVLPNIWLEVLKRATDVGNRQKAPVCVPL